MYSAAKSSLTGVIESPETLRKAASLFVKILGHSIVKLCRMDEESNDVESSDRDKTATTSVDPVTTLGDYELRPSSSIEAVNLNSWPTSSTDSAGLVTNSILFCRLFNIKDRCKKVRFQQTHSQGLRQL